MKYHEPPFEIKELKIEVTHKCTLQCKHCSNDSSPAVERELSLEKCLDIIGDASHLGIKEIAFSGGEPLIWKGLDEAISFASKAGMNITVYSAGNYPNKANRMRKLKTAGAKRIIFSIFGSKPHMHDAVTMSHDSYQHMLDAVNAAKLAGLKVEFHFVPLSSNYHEITSILKLSTKLGINRTSILRFVPQGRGQLLENSEELNRLQNLRLKKSIEDAREKGFNVRTGSPYNFLLLNRKDEASCPSGIDRAIIGPDLRIYPCDAFKQIKAEEIVGTAEYSTLERWSLQECWDNSPFLRAVREYLTTPFPEECKRCRLIELCLSGCLAQKVLISGNFGKQPDPMCVLGKGYK